MPFLKPQIQIGFFTFHLYGIIIAIAIYLGYALAKRRAALYKIPKKIFDDPLLLVPLTLAIIGARAYHVLDYWSLYSKRPVEILYIANGGLGIWGAIAGAVFGFWLVCKIRKLNFLSVLDLVSPSLLLGQAIGRLGNYVNQEGFGPPTSLPWGMYINPDQRPAIYSQYNFFHPTFFYEAALDLIFFIVLIYIEKQSVKFYSSRDSALQKNREVSLKTTNYSNGKFSLRSNNKHFRLVPGQVFALYLMLYSTARFIVEFWRIDTWMISGLKIAHLISIVAFLVGAYLLTRKPLGPSVNSGLRL